MTRGDEGLVTDAYVTRGGEGLVTNAYMARGGEGLGILGAWRYILVHSVAQDFI